MRFLRQSVQSCCTVHSEDSLEVLEIFYFTLSVCGRQRWKSINLSTAWLEWCSLVHIIPEYCLTDSVRLNNARLQAWDVPKVKQYYGGVKCFWYFNVQVKVILTLYTPWSLIEEWSFSSNNSKSRHQKETSNPTLGKLTSVRGSLWYPLNGRIKKKAWYYLESKHSFMVFYSVA
jgi:hypothetical protein